MTSGGESARHDDAVANALAQDGIDTYWEGRFEEALRKAEAAVKASPNFYRGWGVKALALLALGRNEEALAAIEEGIRRAPTVGVLYSIKGICHARAGDDAAAVDAFRRALAISPADDRIYYNFACYWAQVGNGAECRRYLTRALELQPTSVRLAKKDADLARYAGEEWFKELLARYIRLEKDKAGNGENQV